MAEDRPDHLDGGLDHDLPRLLSRRRALAVLGGSGLALLAGCSSGAPSPVGAALPTEGAGPFAADGGSGPDVLARAGVVRRDIRTSLGAAGGTAPGLPLTIRLRVLDASDGAPRPGAAVYLWQCDGNGDYSLYSPATAEQSWLRGVQVAGADGLLEFVSVFPGCYPGRWPHLHVEVFPRLAEATSSGRPLLTTQLALPQEACEQAYTATGYAASARELDAVSLGRDVAFADGSSRQLLTVRGDNTQGWTAELDLPVELGDVGAAARAVVPPG